MKKYTVHHLEFTPEIAPWCPVYVNVYLAADVDAELAALRTEVERLRQGSR